MSANDYAFIALLVISLGVALGIYALVWKILRDLLNETLKLTAGTTFYLRSFLVGLVLVTVPGVTATTFDLKPEAHFMEYVWKFASGLSRVLDRAVLIWVAYLLLVTMLVRSTRDK
ncbi:MAG TPA: hypothetical protein VHM88_04960 [Candidatus Acidoferrales bacterium]|jgi:ABC-type dipeptide/oligopeptide/nickel transport system permease component|nr:hypothetical protein [Candidatus Acidoferrales bacterium]